MFLLFFFRRFGGVFAETVTPHKGKLAPLEGLRGILATSVVAHHAYCWYYFTQTALWGTRDSILFERLAEFGVMQFFFLSGFLFWRKLMMKGQMDLASFYLSRFVRLAPVYYLCAGAAILIGLSESHFRIVVTTMQLVGSWASWLFFSMGGQQAAVNGKDISRILSGVVWTLSMEWCFYLSLPFLGWFCRKTPRLIHLGVLCGAAFVACKYLSSGQIHNQAANLIVLELRMFAKFMLVGFGGGIVIAAFNRKIVECSHISRAHRNYLLLILYCTFLFLPPFQGFQVLGWLCLLGGFALVVQGTDLFGFMTSGPVRFLGVISYDLYLVHAIVYYLAMRLRGGIHSIAPADYMIQTSGCLIVVVLLAALIHFTVERPSMDLSERIVRRHADTARESIPHVAA